MTIFKLTTRLLIPILLPFLSGCAALGIHDWNDLNPFQSDDSAFQSGDKTEANDDPIAAVAAQLRSPASRQASTLASDGPSGRATSEHISLGMEMRDVESVWGSPSDVESAGDPRDGNQRWTYFSGLSSRYGLGTRRIVYFENGRVAGWQNHP